jgi:predicted DNA-binding transcriptional regulator AlpA
MAVSPEDRLLTRREAAEILGLQPQTLARWKWVGRADRPPEIRVGPRAVRYRLSDLRHWIAGRSPGNDSSPGGRATRESAASERTQEPVKAAGAQAAFREGGGNDWPARARA